MSIPTDSAVSAAERRARMAAEQAQRAEQRKQAEAQQAERDKVHAAEARVEEDKFVAQQMSLIEDGETREHLLQRIRDMREGDKKPEYVPPPLTERMRQQLEEEQEAGRRVVARNQANLDAAQDAKRQAEREEAARQGSNVPLHTPNPTMTERFPVNKSTIDKPK